MNEEAVICRSYLLTQKRILASNEKAPAPQTDAPALIADELHGPALRAELVRERLRHDAIVPAFKPAHAFSDALKPWVVS